MKATIVLSTLILFAALMGCSDNASFMGPKDQNQINGSVNQQKAPGQKSVELAWAKTELSVRASTESIVENKCVFQNGSMTELPQYYRIEFDIYTNANKFVNGYIPIVDVFKDGASIYDKTLFTHEDGEDAVHVALKLDNTSFSEIKFYIALMQGDNASNQSIVPVTELKLSNIAVYIIH